MGRKTQGHRCRSGRRLALVLAALLLPGCSGSDGGPSPGPLSLSGDDRLVDEQTVAGRIWRVYNDCAMARNTTWTSDDGGRSWLHHPGPSLINCQVASDVRLHVTGREVAEAEVDQGPDPVHERWRTEDGGATWTLLSTDLGG